MKKLLVFILLLLLGASFPFHYVVYYKSDGTIDLNHLNIFPKENLTLSNTIITEDDITKIIERFNSCENIFQKQSMMNEPLYRKLVEKGYIINR